MSASISYNFFYSLLVVTFISKVKFTIEQSDVCCFSLTFNAYS